MAQNYTNPQKSILNDLIAFYFRNRYATDQSAEKYISKENSRILDEINPKRTTQSTTDLLTKLTSVARNVVAKTFNALKFNSSMYSKVDRMNLFDFSFDLILVNNQYHSKLYRKDLVFYNDKRFDKNVVRKIIGCELPRC